MTQPATPGQLRFFLLDQQEDRATLVNHITVDGPVELERLIAAVRAVAETQPALRTSLQLEPSGLRQRLHPVSAVELEVRHTDAAGEAASLEQLARRVGARFDHGGGPLCRVKILTGPERTHCLFGVHHAVFDDDSAGLLLRHLIAAYEHGAQALPAAVPPAPGPEGERAASLREFWRRSLADCPQDTHIPQLSEARDRDRGAATIAVPSDLAGRMKALARECGATPFTQLLAAAGLVTGWYLGRDDVVIATIASGRATADENVIGCLQNTVPVRLDLTGADTGTLLDRTLDALFDAVDHADLPIEEILTVANATRRPGRKPLTQILCAQGTDRLPTFAAGLTWQLDQPPGTQVEYDLSLALCHSADGVLSLAMEYPAPEMTADAAARLGQHIMRALTELTSGPARPLAELRLLGPDEMLPEAGPAPAADRPVHEIIAHHARRFPDAVAVIAAGQAISYAELDDRASVLTAQLMAAGVSPGGRVGVCLPRDVDMVVALIATWRAGAAYVPLDPEYPADRLRYMAEDAVLTAVVSDDGLMAEVAGVPWVVPGAGETVAPAEGWPAVSPGDAAYLIYTSGSTGRPKGVVVRHDNLSALFAAFDRELGGPPAVTAAGTSLSFDISALELHWPLSRGRSVFLTDHRRVAEDGVPSGALYQCTPTVARILATDPEGRRLLDRLGTLLVGGEPLPGDLAQELVRLVPGPVLNCYGPTETTVWSTVWRVREGVPVHIGRPLPGERCHVVDQHGRPLPAGSPGRLLIGGAGVGDGYWRRPGLTEERFRPFAEAGEGITYDTGDLVVWDFAQGLRFLGRGDHQVKVLGQRIELEEIESVLRSVPGVRDAAVAVSAQSSVLVAHVAATGQVDTEVLRRHATDRLTAAMVPATWLVVPRLPLLPNGKLDRSVVQLWADEAGGTAALPTAPSQSSQPSGVVAEVWRSVLGAPVADQEATFFELGGNSHGVLRVLAALRGAFPQLRAADLFQYTTLRTLSAHLERDAARPAAGPAPGTEAHDTTRQSAPQDGRGATRARALSGWKRRPSQGEGTE
ncbi:amino acid adenylation domain-containing protein [Streptomyces sp. NPDC002742]|uniref:non-ribosomal peptide synthetase n=1 Tax=Streptomyces sp. NPDC002742 TaxID=3364663 RepID=UPI00368D04FD